MTDPAGWKPDPTGRHDHRYFDGTRWTEHVSDAGVAATDPFDGTQVPTEPAVSATTSDPDTTAAASASSPDDGSSDRPSDTTSAPEPASSATPSAGGLPPILGATPSSETEPSSATETTVPAGEPPADDPVSTFRMTEAGTEPAADGDEPPGAPADAPTGPAAAAGPVSSWARPTVINEPTAPISAPSDDEPTSTFRMTEAGTDLGIEGSGLEGIAPAAPPDDDLTLTDVLQKSDDTEVLPASPPPPRFTAPSDSDGDGEGSKRRLLIGAAVLVVIAIVAGFLLLGGDDDSGGSLEDRIAANLREDQLSGFTEDEADCLAKELIDDIGAERLGAIDFAADAPPPEIADELNDAFVKAIPVCDIELGAADGGDTDGPLPGDGTDGADGPTTDATLSGDQLAQFRTLLTEQYRNNLGLSEEKASCLANTMADAIEEGELDESQSFDAFFEYLDACGISVSELGGATGAGTG